MKIVLIYSGGMDSTTLLYDLIRNHEVKCISFDYGQRHKKELVAASEICNILGIEHKIVDLSSVTPLLKGSSQTDDSVEVPEGMYDEPSMKLTVVPNRNMMMLAIAAAWAISLKFNRVGYGAHAGDHEIYPDCRKDFIKAMSKAFKLCDWHKIDIIAPYKDLTKGDIAVIGQKIGVPYEMTWTCYKGLDVPCGKCGACTERKEAMEYAKTVLNPKA